VPISALAQGIPGAIRHLRPRIECDVVALHHGHADVLARGFLCLPAAPRPQPDTSEQAPLRNRPAAWIRSRR
jgi:hypothetical protein